MKQLGTYKKEFDLTINTLAKMLHDYDTAEQAFIDSGGELIIEHTNKAGATNIVKNPYYLIIENLRVSMLQYMRELGLTPTGLKKINEQLLLVKKESVLAKALSKLE